MRACERVARSICAYVTAQRTSRTSPLKPFPLPLGSPTPSFFDRSVDVIGEFPRHWDAPRFSLSFSILSTGSFSIAKRCPRPSETLPLSFLPSLPLDLVALAIVSLPFYLCCRPLPSPSSSPSAPRLLAFVAEICYCGHLLRPKGVAVTELRWPLLFLLRPSRSNTVAIHRHAHVLLSRLLRSLPSLSSASLPFLSSPLAPLPPSLMAGLMRSSWSFRSRRHGCLSLSLHYLIGLQCHHWVPSHCVDNHAVVHRLSLSLVGVFS